MDCEDSIQDRGDTGEVVGNLHAISLHALVGTKGYQTKNCKENQESICHNIS